MENKEEIRESAGAGTGKSEGSEDGEDGGRDSRRLWELRSSVTAGHSRWRLQKGSGDLRGLGWEA